MKHKQGFVAVKTLVVAVTLLALLSYGAYYFVQQQVVLKTVSEDLSATSTPSILQNQEQNKQITVNSSKQNRHSATSETPTCTITALPLPSNWVRGKSNTIELTWTSKGAESAFLSAPQRGKGGDLITTIILGGEKVTVSGTRVALIDIPADSANYPYDYKLVVKGETGVALCTARGEQQSRTLEEQKEAENFRQG